MIKPSCSCVPSKPWVSAPHIWSLFRHLSRNITAVIFTLVHTRVWPSDVLDIYYDISLVWGLFICNYTCHCEQSTLIGWMVYMMGISCWGKGLILSNDHIPAGNDSNAIMPAFESFFSSSLSLPSRSYLHPSFPPTPALNYESWTARHNYDIHASISKMGAAQCSESLVSILIYQGHGVSVSDLTLSSFCFPLSIFWSEDNRMAYLNWPITLESYFRFEAEQFSQT